MATSRLLALAVSGVLLVGCGDAIAPSAEPTLPAPPSAAPTASERLGSFPEFASHTGSAVEELARIVTEIQGVIEEGNPATEDIELSGLGLQLAVWASDEAQWIRENPPSACYEEIWAAYSEAVDTVEGAADRLLDAMDDLERARTMFTVLMSEADDRLGAAVEDLDEVDC